MVMKAAFVLAAICIAAYGLDLEDFRDADYLEQFAANVDSFNVGNATTTQSLADVLIPMLLEKIFDMEDQVHQHELRITLAERDIDDIAVNVSNTNHDVKVNEMKIAHLDNKLDENGGYEIPLGMHKKFSIEIRS